MLKRTLAHLSIRLKLTLVIMAVAISISTVQNLVIYKRDMRVFRNTLRDRITTTASIIGKNLSPSLRFRSRQDALELINSLRAETAINSAYVYTADGGVLAEFVRHGEILSVPMVNIEDEAKYFTDDNLIIIHQINEDSKRLGAIYISCDLTELEESRHERIKTGLLTALLATLISFFLAAGLQRFFTKPIYKLVDVTKQVGRDKDFSLRLPDSTNDEFGKLMHGFNFMLSEIEDGQKKLAEKMTELQRTNKELDQFVYAASHDLKAPLRAVDNLSRLISKAVHGMLPPDKQEFLDLMQNRVRRMEGLIDDLLQYSRVGRVAAPKVEVNIGELLTHIIDLLAPPATFKITFAENMPTIVTTKTPLEQVFRNLINNAIKHHSREDGHIQIQYKDYNEYIEFSISDDGPGIPPQYHNTIFQMFQTLKPRDEVEGSGMGLALVKKIIENQGGTIEVQSSEGNGAKFIFTWFKNSLK